MFSASHCPRLATTVEECTLPLTEKGCVDRTITDLAVLDPTTDGLVLREVTPASPPTTW